MYIDKNLIKQRAATLIDAIKNQYSGTIISSDPCRLAVEAIDRSISKDKNLRRAWSETCSGIKENEIKPIWEEILKQIFEDVRNEDNTTDINVSVPTSN